MPHGGRFMPWEPATASRTHATPRRLVHPLSPRRSSSAPRAEGAHTCTDWRAHATHAMPASRARRPSPYARPVRVSVSKVSVACGYHPHTTAEELAKLFVDSIYQDEDVCADSQILLLSACPHATF